MRRRLVSLTVILGCVLLGPAAAGCRSEAGGSRPGGSDEQGRSGASAEGASRDADSLGRDPDVEPVRLARAALAWSKIPLYPGARGLDATEFDANTAPFVSVDFFSTDPMDRVVAFYDRNLEGLTARRRIAREEGAVRYEFERSFSGLAVKPWEPAGADSSGLLARFDRRDAEGVTSTELDAYGRFLTTARTHVVVNVPRPEP